MNIHKIQEGITKLGPWFHRIDFQGGLSTKSGAYTGEDSDHPLPTWERLKSVIPTDLTNNTVLDIGCNAGFYSFRCRERNAKHVLGIDARLWHIRQARFASRTLNLDRVSFQRCSVYEISPEKLGKYDVVLALGLIYHLKHLYQALENLFWITNKLVIIETAIIPDAYAWPKTSQYGVDQKPLEAIGLIGNNSREAEPPCNWFIPTPNAVKLMLEAAGFYDVKIDNVTDTRAILSAKKPSHDVDSRTPLGIRGKINAYTNSKFVKSGENVLINIQITNTGRAIWLIPSEDAIGGVYITGTVTKEEDPTFDMNIDWVELPRKVFPHETLSIEYTIPAFKDTGTYEIEIDLIAQGVGNFQDFGISPFTIKINVL